MKQLFIKGLVALTLFTGITVKNNAQAVVVADTISSTIAFNEQDYYRYTVIDEITQNTGTAFLCILLLPICVLNEEESQEAILTVDSLTEKGYLNPETIIADHSSCMNELKAQNKSLKLEENETAQSIETGLKTACNASDTLVNYYQNELL